MNAERKNPQDLSALAHAFLFSEGGALSFKKLRELLACKEDELIPALEALKLRLEGTGLTLILSETEAALAIAPIEAGMVQAAFEKDLGREIGNAGLEVLAIILYRGPSTRAEIDYIRGVNTTSTIRNLLARGLLERAGNPDDAREYIYRATTELLAHLGVAGANDLPEHAKIARELKEFETTRQTEETHGNLADTAQDA